MNTTSNIQPLQVIQKPDNNAAAPRFWPGKLLAWAFHAVLFLSFVGGVWAYFTPLFRHGYAKGMEMLLWSCDDAIRIFAKQLGWTYDEANILLLVFLTPAMILVSCIGVKLKSLVVKNWIYYTVLSIGLGAALLGSPI